MIVEILSEEKIVTTPLQLKARHKKTEQENFLQKYKSQQRFSC